MKFFIRPKNVSICVVVRRRRTYILILTEKKIYARLRNHPIQTNK